MPNRGGYRESIREYVVRQQERHQNASRAEKGRVYRRPAPAMTVGISCGSR